MAALGATPNVPQSISHTSFTGHKESVNCVEWSSTLSLLASASDDGTVRLWDARAPRSCVRCISAFDKAPVALVAWAPPQGPLPSALWATAGRDVFAFDLRSTSASGLLVRSASLSMTEVCSPGTDGDDELSSLHVQPSNGKFVAVADDAGTVHLLELKSSTVPNSHTLTSTDLASNAVVQSDEFPDAYDDDPLSEVFSQVSMQVSSPDTKLQDDVSGSLAVPSTQSNTQQSSPTATARAVSIVRKSTLIGGHTSVCSGAYFRATTPRDMVSGALDASLCLWDITKPRRPVWAGSVPSLSDLYPDDGKLANSAAVKNASQSFNPPLAQCMSGHPNGRYFAAGLGDASIAVHAWADPSSNSGPRLLRRLVGGHAAAVAAVHFCAFDEGLLVSGGNDKKLCFWHLGQLFNADTLPKPGNHSGNGGGRSGSTKKKRKAKAGGSGDSNAGGEGGVCPADVGVAVPARLAHSEKINWVSSENLSRTVHLADVTSTISVFDVSRV